MLNLISFSSKQTVHSPLQFIYTFKLEEKENCCSKVNFALHRRDWQAIGSFTAGCFICHLASWGRTEQ